MSPKRLLPLLLIPASLCVSASVLPSSAFAQSGRGTVTGTVSDAQGIAVQGVRVTLSPGNLSALTDSTGQYSFIGVPAGSYTLTTGYSGFEPFTQSLTVSAGQNGKADAQLKIAATEQNVRVFAGRQGGEIEAINRTLNADNIINVLPADVIRSLPNANIADAVGRLASVTLERDEGEGKYVQVRGTEPRLTHVTIDGVNVASAETVRQIKLDIIPSDLVESVQINKTLEANMEGDGIGGSVDLRTKSAGDTTTIALEATGGYTPIINGRSQYHFDGTVGKRFLEGKKLGLLGGGSYDYNALGINDVEPGPLLSGGGYDLRDYQYYRDRTGFAGTIDYRFSDTSNIYLKGLYSLFHNFGNRWDYNVATTFTAAGQPDGTGSVSFGAEIRRPRQDVGNLQFGGHQVIARSLFNWDLDASVGRTRDLGYSDATFNPISTSPLGGNIQFTLDNSNPLRPKLVAPQGVNIFDPSQYVYAGQRKNFYYNPEVDLGFGASLLTNYTAGGHAGTFEFGGRFRNVHKFANQDVRYFSPTATNGDDPSLSFTNFQGGFTDPGYYGSNYAFGPTVDYGKVDAFTSIALNTRRGGRTNNFNLIEKVGAGYAMNSINLGRFRVVGGLRFEHTGERDNGNTSGPLGALITRNGSYLDVLPSASVRYGFTPSSGLRLAYSRGLSRPQFADLVSFATIAPGGVRTTSTVGNPNLKAEHADNFDVLYEQLLPRTGLLQGGFFYKRLTNPILPVQTNIGTTANPNFQTQPQNVGSAYVLGLEVSFEQRFSYLPGALNGLGLSANYSYTKSRVSGAEAALSRSDSPALLRQAPHTWNISPTYDKRRLSTRLGLTYNAANIYAYNYNDGNAGPLVFSGGDPKSNTGYLATGGGLTGPNGDLYLYGHLQIDLQGTYDLGKGFSAVAYGYNLNNEVFGFYQGNTNSPIQREYYKPSFGGGLRWTPIRNR